MSDIKRIKVQISSIKYYDAPKTLKEFMDVLEALADDIPFDQIEIEWEHGYDDEGSSITLYHYRDETDAERRSREQYEVRRTSQLEADERATLARLQAKYSSQ